MPISQGLSGRVQQYAAGIGVTSFHVFLAAYACVISRFSGARDFAVGIPASLRDRPELQGLIGCFINMLAIRMRLDDSPTFEQFVLRVRDRVLDAMEHVETPFESVVAGVALDRRADSTPLFQCLFSFEREAEEGIREISPGLGVEVREFDLGNSVYDLAMEFHYGEQGVYGWVDYSTARFDESIVTQFISALLTLLEAGICDKGISVDRLPLLTDSEREQVIHGFNATQAAYPKDALIHELFEQQVERTPDAVAAQYEEEQLTYAQLNAKANQLAHRLRGLKDASGAALVCPDALVAISVERSLEMVVGLLGILKAGAAYVPIDPSYPAERLRYVLQDSRPVAFLTHGLIPASLRDQLQDVVGSVPVIELDASSELWQEPERENLSSASMGLQPSHLAYVIYTSGSTGKPKGVMVEHQNVTRLFAATQDWFHFGSDDVWTLFHSFAFDFSVWEIWGALLHGGRLVVVPYLVSRSPDAFYGLLCDERVTVLNQTPSAFRQLMAAQETAETQRHCLRTVIFGGEALEPTMLGPWYEREQNRDTQLVNMYGITETTVHVTYRPLNAEDVTRGNSSPIGVHIPDLRVYVLDANRQPVPLGVTGELYVGGAGVARGYLNREELTAERFVDDPFREEPGARMYRTGDLGRWRADGSLEYQGRNDFQVKIRGLRIELGEIEARLAELPAVREVVVLAREAGRSEPGRDEGTGSASGTGATGDRRLVAYWVARDGLAEHDLPTVEVLRDHLKAELPAYMVPSAFVKLDAMPLTPNGKVDRKALPAPDAEALVTHAYEAPQGPVEEVLASIWQELLGVERVGRHDNFFDLGGHSLLIVSMVEKLRRAGLRVDIRQVFQSRDLAELASGIRGGEAVVREVPANLIPEGCTRIRPEMFPLVELTQQEIDGIVETVPGGVANVQDIYPLAPLQEGMLFHHRFNLGNDPYVVVFIISFESKKRFEKFVEAMNEVVSRHDVLRTAILWEGLSQPVQTVYRHAELMTDTLNIVARPEDADTLTCIREYLGCTSLCLDLGNPPLLKVQQVHVEGREQDDNAVCYGLVTFHHVILDHVSLDVITSEIVQIINGGGDRLEEPVPYREFVAHCLDIGREEQARAFFRQMLGGVDGLTAPFGLMDAHGDGAELGELRSMLGNALSQRIRTCVRGLGVSVATLFHVAYGLMLAKCAVRDDVVFGSVLSGRMGGVAGVDKMVGMLINTLPVRLNLKGVSVICAMHETHATLVDLLKYEQTSLAQAQSVSGSISDAARFSVVLNFRHSQVMEGLDKYSGITIIDGIERTNYPFSVSVDDLGKEFSLTVQTQTKVVSPERVLGYMNRAVSGVVDALEHAPHRELLSLGVVPQAEKEQVIHGFNATQAEYPKEALIHELFEQQVERTPEAVAVQYEGESLTYAQLNAKANQLAHRLRAMKDASGAPVVGPDALVVIGVERSLEMVVGLLGILKAGAAYVPVDPEYPTDRIAYMLRDSQAKVLLTQQTLQERLQAAARGGGRGPREILLLDDEATYAGQPEDNIGREETGQTSRHLAYVIYTSGSTGQPKGVMVEHQQQGNLLPAIHRAYGLTERDRVLQFVSMAFDVAAQEIFGTLTSGAALVLRNEACIGDSVSFWQACQAWAITVAHLPAAFWHRLAYEVPNELPAALRLIALGGERLDAGALSHWFERQGERVVLLNEYGPTETTVTATVHEMKAQEVAHAPIGRPLANVRIYVLDGQGQPAPLGVQGEICIGGEGVARGYLNQQELTEEKFVKDPFSDALEARMYRTGDLGYWQADGVLQFAGRNDDQVKIRGFRVELGEIEARLAELPEVREVLVLAREDQPGDKRLVAYWTARDEGAAEFPGVSHDGSIRQGQQDVEQLRDHLKAELPAYMVPSAFVKLEAMPLTPNGKVDRKALPEPDVDALITHAYEAPQGPVEEVLAGIWQELLGVERVGRHDNFFDLGGHSLLVMSMHERLRKRGIDLSISQIFYSPTLKDLSVSFVEERSKYIISDCLVVMREGEGTPLFLVHDGSGDVLSYIELVGLLSGNCPVFGIRAMGLDFETGVLDSIESMASEYIKSIKKVYKKGAFRFAGWSVGGIIAYEMARQLSSSGESVEFVVMIDSYLLGYLSDVAEGLSARSAALYLLGFVNESLDKTVTERIENMKDVDDVFRECYNLGFKSLGMSMEDMMKAVKMLCSMGKTVHAYRPGGFDGNHYILLADQLSVRDNGGVSDELKMRGWGQGGCRMPKAIKIGGDHQSIMKPPYIQRVAENINKFMQ